MKGEIIDGSKDVAFDLDEHVETIWKALDDGLTVEIVWEALNLIELYFTLRMIGHILLAVEYTLIEVGTDPLDFIKKEFVQLKKITGDFCEKGKSWLWQVFDRYHISGTGINVHGQLRKSKKDNGLYGDFAMFHGYVTTHPLISYVTETLTSSYCC